MKVSLKIILIIGLIGLVAVSVSVITLSSIVTSKKVLLQHSHNIMENIAEYTISRSRLHLIPAKDAATLTRGLAKSNVVNSENSVSLLNYFYEQLAVHKQFSGIYFGNTKGEFIMASRNDNRVKNGFLSKIISIDQRQRTVKMIWKNPEMMTIAEELAPNDTYDPRVRPWFIKATKNEQFTWTDPYIFFTSQKPGITSASPVYDTKGDLVGVIGVDIEIDEISDFLSKLKIGKAGKAFIVAQNGDVIAFPDISKIKYAVEGGKSIRLTKIDELADEISQKTYRAFKKMTGESEITKPVFLSVTHQDENFHAMFAPFKNSQWPWLIGIYIPEDDYLGDIKNNSVFNIYVSIFIAFIFSILGLMIARSILKPVNRLRRAAIAVQQNDLTTEFETESIYSEIQETAETFEQMRKTLKKEREFLEDKVAERTEDYRKAKEEADRANERKSEFLANMSHELRTPLNGIISYSRLAISRFDSLEKDKTLRYFKSISKSGDQLLSQINDLLDLSKQEAGRVEYNFMPADFAALVEEVITELNVLSNQKNIKVTFSTLGIDDFIWMDAQRVAQVVRNLLSNAIKFSPENSEIQITVKEENHQLVYSIIDQGVGIPEDELEAIFDKFTQSSKTKTEGGGTGLGLSICRHIISDHHGKIWASNNETSGATFFFTLPIEREI